MSKLPSLKGISPGALGATSVFKAEARARNGGRIRANQLKEQSGFNPRTPLPTEASTPCLEGESHHWKLEGGYAEGGVRVGRCQHCKATRTWTLEPIASVVPQSYERDGAEYLARLR